MRNGKLVGRGSIEMKKGVYIVSDAVISTLGVTSKENYTKLREGHSGIARVEDNRYGPLPFFGSVLNDLTASAQYTRFEHLAIEAGREALKGYTPEGARTILILSTTKGNIELLAERADDARLSLHATAARIARALRYQHIQVVSNACISGVLAIITAQRLLAAGVYDDAIVIGAEVLSSFIVSGFRSLQALSEHPCKPFDIDRTGISLGEAAGAMVLTTRSDLFPSDGIAVLGAGVSNDANHISGPSRTGHELALAVGHALKAAALTPKDIDMVSAHGTATRYNDEMEAKAFALAGLSETPLNSLKGYYGHTLGAAGVIESVITRHGLCHEEVLATKGFNTLGVSVPVNVSHQCIYKRQQRILKTASGFGGCNAAVVLARV